MRFTKFTDIEGSGARRKRGGRGRTRAFAAALAASVGFAAMLSGCSGAVPAGAQGSLETKEGQGTAAVNDTESSTAFLDGTEDGSGGDTLPDGAVSENAAGGAVSGNGTESAAAKERERVKVRGIYVSGPMAGTAGMDELIRLVDETELNALVIDVKNDDGYLTCDLNVPFAEQIGAQKHYVKDMPALIRKCKEKGIYLIARIVAFKDPVLAEAMPELSLHKTDGSIFYDKSGLAWVNPYRTEVWDYLVSVGVAAVQLGFDEVQFDYVRFSTDSGMKQVDFGDSAQEKTKMDAITGFTEYASEKLHDMGAAVSADVYGVVIDSRIDQEIVGQDYAEMCRSLDAISPMVYPSHYGPYNYNIPVPDAQPYDTVLAAMQASKMALAGLDPKTGAKPEEEGAAESPVGVSGNDAAAGAEDVSGNDAVSAESVSGSDAAETESVSGNDAAGTENVSGSDLPAPAAMSDEEIAALAPQEGVRASVRPWLQDFTATWVKGHIPYGAEEIRAQIQAVYDAGYDEWILWNAANRYTEEGLYGPDGKPEQERTAETETGTEAGIPAESAGLETAGGV